MVPYKKIDLIVEAFARMPQRRLVVIGDGPDMQKIRAKAAPNVEIMGYQPFKVLQDQMQRAKAFVFAAEEDFGISVVEAQACGTPVIAYGKGGALETVRDLSERAAHRHVLRRTARRIDHRRGRGFRRPRERVSPPPIAAPMRSGSPPRISASVSLRMCALLCRPCRVRRCRPIAPYVAPPVRER